jgi:hypoxanthine phosphoribosyltransferase
MLRMRPDSHCIEIVTTTANRRRLKPELQHPRFHSSLRLLRYHQSIAFSSWCIQLVVEQSCPSGSFGVRVILTEAEISVGIATLARQIAADYHGRPLTVLGVLTGSLIFLSDLIRRMDLPLKVGLVQASSYRGPTTSPGTLAIADLTGLEIAGRHVLLLDDIFDTGQTLSGIVAELQKLEPASLRSAVLLWKEGRQQVKLTPDYHCFRIPDVFVVGYGLDYNDEYRHLPHVAALEEHDH